MPPKLALIVEVAPNGPVAGCCTPFASSFAGRAEMLTGGITFTRRALAIFWGRELPHDATGGDDDRDGAALFRFVGPDGTCVFAGLVTDALSRTSENDDERPIWTD